MISRKYMERLGLSENQITLLMDAMKKETRYRSILESEHVTHIESIIKLTDTENLDLSNEDLIREKIRLEYSDLIIKK